MQVVIVASARVDDAAGLEFAATLAGEHKRDVGQVMAARAIAPALHAEQHRTVVQRRLAAAIIDRLQGRQQAGEFLGIVGVDLDEAGDIAVMLERMVGRVDAAARPGLAAGAAGFARTMLFLGPFRVRELVWVRCPRTGKPFR